MRVDENNQPCPETLGEYLDLTKAIFGDLGKKATDFLERKISESPNGRDEKVATSDYNMRALIFTLVQEQINGG